MISLAQCAAFAGLASDEILLGVTPSSKHCSLLSSYTLNLKRGPVAVREMIVADLRRFRELGAMQRAADLLFVLRVFLTQYPGARCIERLKKKLPGTDGSGSSSPEGKIIDLAARRTLVSLLPRTYPNNCSAPSLI